MTKQNFRGVWSQGSDGRSAYIELKDDQTISVEMYLDNSNVPETKESFVSVRRLIDVANEIDDEDAAGRGQ